MHVGAGEGDRAGVPLLFHGRIIVDTGPEHCCRAVITSADLVTIETAASGHRGDRVTCYLDCVGALPGRIGNVMATGFTLEPTFGHERRARFMVRLAWHTDHSGLTSEQRRAVRIAPACRDVVVRLADGRILAGWIVDISRTGSKIRMRSDFTAYLGSAVTVGKRYARVVRIEGETIAVEFDLPFCDETFNESVRP